MKTRIRTSCISLFFVENGVKEINSFRERKNERDSIKNCSRSCFLRHQLFLEDCSLNRLHKPQIGVTKGRSRVPLSQFHKHLARCIDDGWRRGVRVGRRRRRRGSEGRILARGIRIRPETVREQLAQSADKFDLRGEVGGRKIRERGGECKRE